VVLAVRPHGLLGRPESLPRGLTGETPPLLLPADRALKIFGAALGVALLAAPALVGDYALVLLIETLIFVLFAASLHFLMGPGGMVSFGHAAYFGLGAYTAALMVRWLAAPMLPSLAVAPVVAAVGALVFGWFCVRLSGVYLAMLTLAFAQIVWSVVFQWYDVTGGDNGILGVWPAAWARPRWAYYYLTLALTVACVVALRRVVFAPFGYALRAGRDSPLRADAIGIDVRRRQWLAFTLAGGFAGLAGALFAFAKGSVFPQAASIPTSIDGLVMVLLGGVQTMAGPIVGAAVYHGLEAEIMRATDYWRAAVGLAILALVLAFPQGLAGFARSLRDRHAG
jgi:branched-chain amino acid transport system permease protein